MKAIYKEIDVICKFTTHMIPTRFRIISDDGENKAFDVKTLKCDEIKEGKDRYLIYTCRTVINNNQRLLELRYDLQKTKWILYRI